MIDRADKISADFDYVRVDFYNINGEVFFGEMTFTPAAGTARFYPRESDYAWGALF